MQIPMNNFQQINNNVGVPDAPMGATSPNDYKIEFDPNSQKMVVQFPEAYAQYEYQHDSKKFMKVITPRNGSANEMEDNSIMSANNVSNTSMFRHIIPQQAAQPTQIL